MVGRTGERAGLDVGDAELGLADADMSVADAIQEISSWLLTKARKRSGPTEMFSCFCDMLVEAGVPLARASLAIETRHAEQAGLGWFWQSSKEIDLQAFPYGSMAEEIYQRSPFARVHETRPRNSPLCTSCDGFPLHANITVEDHDATERLCRYIASSLNSR